MLLYWQCQAEPIFVSTDGKAARAAGLFPVVNGSGYASDATTDVSK